MFTFFDAFIFLTTLITTYVVYQWLRHRFSKLPPGPFPLPLFGNLLSLRCEPAQSMLDWSKIFGSTLLVHIGHKKQVVLHSYNTAKTVFNDDNTTGRDQTFILTRLLRHKGFLGFEKETWKQHRRFVLSTLRDLGMGKSWIEDAILAEVHELIQILGNHAGQPHNPRPYFSVAVSNVICAMIFGKRFDHADAKFSNLLHMLNDNFTLVDKVVPLEILPLLKHLPINTKGTYDRLRTQIEKIRRFLDEMINDRWEAHQSQTEPDNIIRSFVELYRKEMNLHPNSELSDEDLTACVMSLFAAGSDTTANTLIWAILYLLENPDVLRKVHQELDRLVGNDRPVHMSDRVNLPYTDAVLHEVQRLASVVPLSVAHTNFETMVIDGFKIPRRTILNLNIYAIHRDPTVWKNAHKFDPHNFLTAEGALVVPKEFIPFGIGQRVCLGQTLAKTSLFLFFSNLVKSFDLEKPAGFVVSADKPLASFIRSPQPFNAHFIPKH